MSDNHRWGASNSLSAYPLHFPQRNLRGASVPPSRVRRQSESVLSNPNPPGSHFRPDIPSSANHTAPPRNQKVHPSAFSASHARNLHHSDTKFSPSQQKPAFFLPLNTPKDELDYNDITSRTINSSAVNNIDNDLTSSIDDLYSLEEYDTFPQHHDHHYAAYYNALHANGYSRPVSRSASPVRSSSFARQRAAHLDSLRRDSSNDYATTMGTSSQSAHTRSLPMSIPMPSARPDWFVIRPMPNSNSHSNNEVAVDSDEDNEERRGRCSLPRRVSISKQY